MTLHARSFSTSNGVATSSFVIAIIIIATMFLLIHSSNALKCYSGSFTGSITPITLQNNLTQVSISASGNVCYSYKVAMNGVLNVFGEMSSECSATKSKGSPYFDVACCTVSDLCNTGATSGVVAIPTMSSSLMMFVGLIVWCCCLF